MTYRARTSILGRIPGTDVFESIDICETVKIFNFIYFFLRLRKNHQKYFYLHEKKTKRPKK